VGKGIVQQSTDEDNLSPTLQQNERISDDSKLCIQNSKGMLVVNIREALSVDVAYVYTYIYIYIYR